MSTPDATIQKVTAGITELMETMGVRSVMISVASCNHLVALGLVVNDNGVWRWNEKDAE